MEVVETIETRKQRTERVLFETDRHLVIGDVILPSNGYQGRFSDAINRTEISFIPLLDVEMIPLEEGQPVTIGGPLSEVGVTTSCVAETAAR